jgi:hypothetical protein
MPESFHLHKSSLYKQVNVFLLIIPGIVFVFVLVSYFILFPQNNRGKVAAYKTEAASEETKELDTNPFIERELEQLQNR